VCQICIRSAHNLPTIRTRLTHTFFKGLAMRIHISMSKKLKTAIEKQAEARFITISEYIRGLIIDDMGLGNKSTGRPQTEKKEEKIGDIVTRKIGTAFKEFKVSETGLVDISALDEMGLDEEAEILEHKLKERFGL